MPTITHFLTMQPAIAAMFLSFVRTKRNSKQRFFVAQMDGWQLAATDFSSKYLFSAVGSTVYGHILFFIARNACRKSSGKIITSLCRDRIYISYTKK